MPFWNARRPIPRVREFVFHNPSVIVLWYTDIEQTNKRTETCIMQPSLLILELWESDEMSVVSEMVVFSSHNFIKNFYTCLSLADIPSVESRSERSSDIWSDLKSDISEIIYFIGLFSTILLTDQTLHQH